MIYCIQRVDGGSIKIGTTICLSERLRNLCYEYNQAFHVIAVTDGGREREKQLHARFASIRIGKSPLSEWFDDVPELRAFIEAECQPWDGRDEVSPGVSVGLKPAVIEAARIVSAFRGETMTDMLSDILEPILAKMEQEETAKRAKTKKGKA